MNRSSNSVAYKKPIFAWRRVKGVLKRVKVGQKAGQKSKTRANKTKDLDLIAAQKDPTTQLEMYKAYQRGKNVRVASAETSAAVTQNVTPLAASAAYSKARSTDQLEQNVNGGAKITGNTRDEEDEIQGQDEPRII